ncbi:MAG: hypothetical protein WAO58_07690 [Fimbriimonadaceae bacterium]
MVLLAALAVVQGSGWQTPTSLSASGYVQMQSGARRSFTIARSGPLGVYMGTQPIGTDLVGIPRAEVAGPQGVFTWIGEKPKFILQLPYSSTSDFNSMLRPPSFGKNELLKTPDEVGRKLGGKVKIGERETIDGREAIVYDLGFGDLIKRAWLDAESGTTLRQQDLQGSTIIAERGIESFDKEVPPSMFEKPAGTIIRGIAKPGILQRAGKPGDAANDVEKAEKSCKMTYKGWIRPLPEIEGFLYTQTFDWSAASRKTVQPGNAVSPAVPLPPPGVTLSRQGDVTFVTASDSSVNFQVALLELSGNDVTANLDGVTSRFRLAVDNPSSPMNTDVRAGASGYLQSDYLDTATGDTVTIIQTANLRLDSFFNGIKLPKPMLVKGTQGMESYSVTAPFKLNVVVWQRNGAIYAIASTRHEIADLAKIAQKLDRGN